MKAIYDIIKKDERIFFFDGEKYVLLDTGFIGNPFGRNSVSVNGSIGNIAANTMPQHFFDSFINLNMEDNRKVTAIFNPMDGYNCLLQGNTLVISDEDLDHSAETVCFLEFVKGSLPILNGKIGGRACRFFFDSGARMTMFGERELAASPEIRSYREWMAMLHKYSTLPVFKMELEFAANFKYSGEGALVEDPTYLQHAKMLNIRAMLGIDIFEKYDLYIAAKGPKRGIFLHNKQR